MRWLFAMLVLSLSMIGLLLAEPTTNATPLPIPSIHAKSTCKKVTAPNFEFDNRYVGRGPGCAVEGESCAQWEVRGIPGPGPNNIGRHCFRIPVWNGSCASRFVDMDCRCVTYQEYGQAWQSTYEGLAACVAPKPSPTPTSSPR